MDRRAFLAATGATATAGCSLRESSAVDCQSHEAAAVPAVNAATETSITATTGHWPTPVGPADGTRSLAEADYGDPVGIVWRREVDARPGGPTPVLVDETVYVVDGARRLVALSLRDGRRLWRDDTVAVDGPVAAGRELLYLRRDGRLVAFDPDERRVVWTFEPPGDGASLSLPVPDGESVFLHDDSTDELYALDQTGERVWQASTTVRPVVGEGTVVVRSDGELRALRRDTGRRTWRQPVDGPDAHRLAVRDGRVFGTDNGVLALDRQTGAELWTHDPAGGRTERPAVGPRQVYVPTAQFQWYGRRLYTYDHAGPDPTGCRETASFVAGGPVVATDDHVVVAGGVERDDGSTRNRLWALDHDGDPVWRVGGTDTEARALCAGRRALLFVEGERITAVGFAG